MGAKIRVDGDKVDRYDFMSVDELKAECRRFEGIDDTTCLYEATNGEEGKADVRVYVWAREYDEALLMAKRSFQENGCKNWDFAFVQLRRLFRKSDQPFVTEPSDVGFERKHHLEPL